MTVGEKRSENMSSGEDCKKLVADLASQFYDLGWFPGSGGSLTMRKESELYFAPSGVQKERISPDEVFVCNLEGSVKDGPAPEKGLKQSQCTPLFMVAYKARDAGAVIHSHAKEVVLASLIYKGKEFRIRNQHMIKGIWNNVEGRPGHFDEELVIPIIENEREDYLLVERMREALEAYPASNAVILRHHGIHVWGENWKKAKLMAEAYHYLLDVAVEMHKLGINEYTI